MSRYDLVAEQYQLPRIDLRAAEACIEDWIYYEETGSAGGHQAYVAADLMQSICPDPADRTLRRSFGEVLEPFRWSRPT